MDETLVNTGIHLSGYFNSEKGMGEAVRAAMRCLEKANYPFVLHNVVDSFSKNQEFQDAKMTLEQPYAINLIHVNADQQQPLIKKRGLDYFMNCYNIAHWEWELAQFPEEWLSSFQLLDEVWVSSSYIQKAIANISPVPVIRVPHVIKIIENVSSRYDKSFFHIPDDKYVFLFMFDFDSCIVRKNPQGLIKAFLSAFSVKDNAVLVIKSSHSSRYPDELAQLKKLIKNNIILIDEVLPKEQVDVLMYHADCYVSLHRCEGFGLTVGEAMGCGKPVITTAYSGNVDFIQPGNSYPVNYRLMKIDKDYGPYKKGWVWADPDLKHAAQLMRYVYENPGEAKKVGEKAREYIRDYFSLDAVVKIYQERMNNIVQQDISGLHSQKNLLQLRCFDNIKKMIDGVGIQNIACNSQLWIIKHCQRLVRKSSAWLLNSLVSQWRDSQYLLLGKIEQQQREIEELKKIIRSFTEPRP